MPLFKFRFPDRRMRRLHYALLAGCSTFAMSDTWAKDGDVGTVLNQVTVEGRRPEEFRQIDKLEITGSAIVRKEQTDVLPVTLVTRDEIRRMGVTSVAELVHRLPMMMNYVEPGQFSALDGGYSSGAIHGMRNGTLVLVNGKRYAPYGDQTISGERSGVNLAQFPLTAIERIELLTDGASSLYGADAIAGVLNIVTRNDRTGLELSAEAHRPRGGVANGWAMSVAGGIGKLNQDGYHLSGAVELAQRDALPASARASTSHGKHFFSANGNDYSVEGPLIRSLNTSPATLYALGGGSWHPYYENGKCPEGWYPAPAYSSCFWNAYSILDVYPDESRQAAQASLEVRISPEARFYSEVLYGKQVQVMRTNKPPVRVFRGLTEGMPGYAEARAVGITGSPNLYWAPNEMGGQAKRFSDESFRLAFGVRGYWRAWDYHWSAYASESLVRRDWSRLIASYAGPVRAEMLAPLVPGSSFERELQDLVKEQAIEVGKTTIRATELRASRPLFELPGGNAEIGAGLELRREAARTEPRSATGGKEFKAARTDAAAYSELRLPWSSAFETSISGRVDRYTDFGVTSNGKAAVRWTPKSGLMLRGAIGSGFRAPTLGQMQDVEYLMGTTQGLYPCDVALATSLNATCPNGNGAAASQYTVRGGGNSSLRPERSRQLTLGFRADPTLNFSFGADFWRVDIRDMLGTLNEAVIFGDTQAYARYFGTMLTSSNQRWLVLRTPVENIGREVKQGIDFDVRIRRPTPIGRVSLNTQATWMLKSRQRSVIGAGETSDLGEYSGEAGSVTPRLRLRSVASVSRPGWAVNLALNFLSGYRDAVVRGAVNLATGKTETVISRYVPAFSTIDLTAHYFPTRQVEVKAGIFNVFNKEPALTFAQSGNAFGVDTRYANPYGRTLQAAVTVRF